VASHQTLQQVLTQASSLDELDIPPSIITDLVLRLLFNEGDVSLTRFAEVIHIYPQILDDVLIWMQQEHQVEVAKAGAIGRLSYVYRLTDEGARRARDAMERTLYIGPAPVSLEAYRQAITLQTIAVGKIGPAEVKRALGELALPDNFHRRIGPALSLGSSLFLYGPPGNGKTHIAQCIAGLISGITPIWLPQAITVGGQIIQVFDPLVHLPANSDKDYVEQFGKVDRRWQLYKRPTVMVGGELKMEALDLRFDPIAKFYEAPLQLKANGGMFLLDDFGRQQIRPLDLLNRWIFPLESGFDFLRLQTGQTLDVPFRQLIVFATNLNPLDLVDDAFLRRIQMKVEVSSPDEKLFYQIFVKMCQSLNITFDRDAFLYLRQKWYVEPGRTMQSVHPRDILRTVTAICSYEGIQPRLVPGLIDEACRTYFVQ
jgi:predicted ATPase with chaperone activity